MNWQDYLAFRVLDLQKQLATEKRKVRDRTRSRDMWKLRALRKAGLRA